MQRQLAKLGFGTGAANLLKLICPVMFVEVVPVPRIWLDVDVLAGPALKDELFGWRLQGILIPPRAISLVTFDSGRGLGVGLGGSCWIQHRKLRDVLVRLITSHVADIT